MSPVGENEAMAILEFTLISASIYPYVQLDFEPKDTYAMIRCAKEQQRTKTRRDHGRSPVWNETFAFNLGDQDVPQFIFVQVFATRSNTDELLGVARISISTTGTTEASLHVLVSPDKGETGTLKAAWRWKSTPWSAKDGKDHSSVMYPPRASTYNYPPAASNYNYPPAASTYDEVTSSMAKLAVHKGQEKEPRHPTAYGSVSLSAYPLNYEAEERTFTSKPYPPPTDLSKTSYAPNTDAYPPYPDHHRLSSSSSTSHFPSEKEEGERSPSNTTRGLGDTKDRGHHSHMPYGYPPPGVYGGNYPPPPGYPSPYGPMPGGYPPAPPYPPAPHSNIPPAPYGYPPAYPTQPYSPYGYPPQVPYPVHPGHGSYAPGMYPGYSSHGKHSKHYKMPKHSMSHYGQPFYGHYKHKKHKGFGKGYKLKKFKGFKKFKF